jgi:ligand-binding sensor domain-containing protein
MKHIYFAILAFPFFFNTLIFAQNEEWFVYDTTNSGLKSQGVYLIEIDKSNTKWIGSISDIACYGTCIYGHGLTKFDDSEWTHYDTLNSGLPSNSVTDISEDSEGIKWITTKVHVSDPFGVHHMQGGGLAKFDGHSSWTVYDTSNSEIPTNSLSCIEIDEAGNKWIGTIGGWGKDTVYASAGLLKFDGTTWTVYDTSNSGLPSNVITCLIYYSDTLWIGTNEGLATFDGINWNVYDLESFSGLSNYVTSIKVDKSGNKWIGTSDRNDNGGVLTHFIEWDWVSLFSDDIRCIEIDHSDNIWIGKDFNGLIKLATGWTEETIFDSVKVYNTSNSGLPNDWIYSIALDDMGNKWIGTREGGLAVYNEDGIAPTRERDGFTEVQPIDFKLNQNYPNPFNPVTMINYQLPLTNVVDLSIYNILGQKVATLVNEKQKPGHHHVEWDASGFASGVYYYRIQAGKFVDVKKMILLR